jgi:hypothetical protein
LLYFVLAKSRNKVGNQERYVTPEIEDFMGHESPPCDEILLTYVLYEDIPAMLQHGCASHSFTTKGVVE